MDVEYIIVHGTFTPAHMDVSVGDLERWHVKENGWSKVGYHRLINRGGRVESILPLDEPGIHAAGFNDRSVGIALAGGQSKFNGEAVWDFNYTPYQMAVLTRELIAFKAFFPNAEVVGHRDVDDRRCPGFEVKELAKCL